MLAEVLNFLRDNAALMVAVCALGLSVQQSHATRKHQRLSARPYLRFNRIAKLNEGIIQLLLDNQGPGPAFIDAARVFLDGKERPLAIDLWFKLGAELNLPLKSGGGQLFGAGDVVPPQSTLVVAEFKSAESLAAHAEQAQKVFDRITVEVDYQSVFKEKFNITSGHSLFQSGAG